MHLVLAPLAAVGTTTMTTGTGVWRGSSSFTCNIKAAWWRLVAHRGGGSGDDGEDRSGPLSGTFSGGDDGAVYGGFFALQLVCSFTPNPSSQMLSAISSLFANRRPGSTIFLGDTGAVIHGVSSADCVYNRRQPRPWERYLMLGDGKCMTVGFYGDLDLDLHCEQDVRVTLTNVAVVPGLAFDIMSFNRMQEKH